MVIKKNQKKRDIKLIKINKKVGKFDIKTRTK